MDTYNDSKAKDGVDFLDSNRKNGLLTPLMVGLRPAGIFG
jgi:hypothetical protein